MFQYKLYKMENLKYIYSCSFSILKSVTVVPIATAAATFVFSRKLHLVSKNQEITINEVIIITSLIVIS